jgi:murein L,D-transpeptidase YcbB/YkuD
MSNKGLTFIIFVLILLCAATFGAFYLKMNPQIALSQKIFGVNNPAENVLTNNTSMDSPFTDSTANDSAYVNTMNTTNSITENGVTVSPDGGQNDTVIPNDNTIVSTDTSKTTVTEPTVVDAPVGPITQILKKGSKGAQVKIVQQFLIDNKYLTGKADGSFGSMTENAVKKFQAEYKINVDGVVDGKTRDTLNELLTG